MNNTQRYNIIQVNLIISKILLNIQLHLKNNEFYNYPFASI